ncbi:MAG: hypothetical protein IPK97_14265 [Ahniella sp.]|nr:hypothetical protein [Ahniella sp.]
MDSLAKRLRWSLLWVTVLVLAACKTMEPPPPPPPPPEPPKRDWLSEIRTEAAQAELRGGAFPLADADVLSLRKRAERLERERQFAEAERLLAEALTLMAEDPALWQQRAELALAQRRFNEAEEHARKAESLGIDFGELCVRIRLTQAAAREEATDITTAQTLREKARACFPPELPRF